MKLRAAILFAAILGVALGARALIRPASPALPPFTLIEARSGQPFTERDLGGRPTLLFFGFTACPDVCPTALSTLTRWLRALGPEADELRAVFVTVDPERDTVTRLAEYLGAFDRRILGLTGERKELEKLIQSYHVVANKVPAGDSYAYEHTSLILELDARGDLIGTVDFEDADEEAIAKLKRLIHP